MKNTFTSIKIIHYRETACAFIIFNRPSCKNALDGTLLQELTRALAIFQQDKTVRVICLTGSRDFFCAGADLAEIKNTKNRKKILTFALLLSSVLHQLYTIDKPVLGIVQGGACGGGIGLMACCDMVIAESQAIFCFPEAKIGLIPAIISPYVIHAMGERNAKRYFLTAETFTATQALQMGLIHQVSDPACLGSDVDQMLDRLFQNSAVSIQKTKQLFLPVQTTRQKKLCKLFATLAKTPEVQAYIEKFSAKKSY